jgi:hypothetical protein
VFLSLLELPFPVSRADVTRPPHRCALDGRSALVVGCQRPSSTAGRRIARTESAFPFGRDFRLRSSHSLSRGSRERHLREWAAILHIVTLLISFALRSGGHSLQSLVRKEARATGLSSHRTRIRVSQARGSRGAGSSSKVRTEQDEGESSWLIRLRVKSGALREGLWPCLWTCACFGALHDCARYEFHL